MPTYTGIIQDQGGAVHDLHAYGATGNGTTDDTNAIRAAIAAVPEGGTLFIPNGRFRITDTIHINRPISIRGAGPGSAFWVDLADTSRTGIVIGLLNPVAGGVQSVAHNQSYGDFGVFGPMPSTNHPGPTCKYGLAIYHCARSRFENIHVRPGSTHHAIVIGGSLYCHFNFIVTNNAQYGYPADTGLWNGAAVMVPDLRSWENAVSEMPTNACVFDCILQGGTGGGLAFEPQPDTGGNNEIMGAYESFSVGSGTVYGTGYGLLIDGCHGFNIHDMHVERTLNGSLISNSGAFSIQDGGFFTNAGYGTESLRIQTSNDFRIDRVTVGLLEIDAACNRYDVQNLIGSKSYSSQPRTQDAFVRIVRDPGMNNIIASTGMGPFTAENLIPNGDLSRWPLGFSHVNDFPTMVRTTSTRRFHQHAVQVSGASGASQTLMFPVPNSERYRGQPVTVWADIKPVSGPTLLLAIREMPSGIIRPLGHVADTERAWVRVAVTYYPQVDDWHFMIKPLTNVAYEYYLGGVGALVGVAAPMGAQSPAPSFESGLQLTGKRMEYGSAAPATGTWQPGDIVYNAAPSAGGTVGWVCITAGTPGTWKTFGAISA